MNGNFPRGKGARGARGLLAGALFLVLGGCMGSPEEEKPFLAEAQTEILTLDLENRAFSTREIRAACSDAGSPHDFQDTIVKQYRYRIAGGVLRAWFEGECFTRIRATGSSPTLLGSWTSEGVHQDSVPLEDRSPACTNTLLQEISDSLGRNLRSRYEFSREKLTTRVSGEVCFAEAEAIFLFIPGAKSRLENMHCTRVTLVNGNTQAKAEFSSRYVDADVNRLEVKFSHAGKTCTKVSSSDETCAGQAQDDASREAFKACIQESGFLDGGP